MIIQPLLIGGGSSGTANITADENFRFGYSTFESIPQDVLDFLDGRSGGFNAMFYYCDQLTSISGFADIDLSNVTTLTYSFAGTSRLSSADLSGADFSSCVTFQSMFDGSGATNITFSGAKVNTNTTYPFNILARNCRKLTTLTLDFVNNTMCSDVTSLCQNDSELTTLIFGTMDFAHVRSVTNTFYGCSALTTVTGTLTNIGKAFTANTTLDLSYCPLTNASAMVFINGLYDLVTAGSSLTHTIKFSSTAYGNLSAADIAVATAKGWTVTS